MYTLNFCTAPGCKKQALSTFDENGNITESSGFCLEHTKNASDFFTKLHEYVRTHDKIVGLYAYGVSFSDIDLGNKKFYGCNFQHCTFNGVKSNALRMRMCMFDFSTLINCSLIASNIQFSSFANSNFEQVLFTESDLIDNNFNGLNAIESSFDDSDLYNSRFIRATLDSTSFRNCNIKKTLFFESQRNNVSFKMSNTREALFDRDNTGLISELDSLSEEDMAK